PLERGTPETRKVRVRWMKSLRITRADLTAAKRAQTDGTEAGMIGLGSPQLSAEELKEVARKVERPTPRIPVWVFTSRIVPGANPEAVAALERNGRRVLADTCLEG